MERARKLSDIRSNGAPAFRLKATFSFIGLDLNTAHGTYEEVWVSPSQWWRETVVDNRRRIEVGTANRIWQLDSSKDFPEAATHIPNLMNMFNAASATFDFESVDNLTDQKTPEECATTKPGSQQERYKFCFDQKSGALLATLSPEIRPKNMTDYSCFYGIFRKFSDFWFPREMGCFEDNHKTIEAKVEDLIIEPSPDSALFKPPQDAIELCSLKPIAPAAMTTTSPSISSTNARSVVLRVTVDATGKPQEVTVSESGGKHLDEAAIEAIRKWRFKSATCAGDPIPAQITVNFHF